MGEDEEEDANENDEKAEDVVMDGPIGTEERNDENDEDEENDDDKAVDGGRQSNG